MSCSCESLGIVPCRHVIPLRRSLPCVREGAIVEFCTSCPASAEGKHVRDCERHGRCTRAFVSDKVQACDRCPDYDDGNRPWHHGSGEFLRTLPPYPEGRWSGRGVVIAGGGSYWPSTYVTIRMLRHVGCTLPVQVWYLGAKGEGDERYERLLASFGVTCVDIDTHPARAARRGVSGFNTKLFAVINSPFEEVLSLDADNYPCADPTVLFDDDRYKAAGGIYWPDLPETNNWTRWPFWGVEKHGPNCGFETGQYVLNKRLAYEPMMLAAWYDDRPEHCYNSQTADHGDKGPHRVAWARFKRSPVVFNERVRWEGCAFIQPGPDGWAPMFVHRTRGKITLETGVHFVSTPQQHGANKRCGLPMETEAFGYLDELRRVLK